MKRRTPSPDADEPTIVDEPMPGASWRDAGTVADQPGQPEQPEWREVQTLIEHDPDAPDACPACGARFADAGDGFCVRCGARMRSAPRLREGARVETEITQAAAVSDPGMRHRHNQDAIALASGITAGKPWTVLVVCDGVSASSDAEQASAIAARTACDLLAEAARHTDLAHGSQHAMGQAVRAAHLAICRHAATSPPVPDPPGTTIVAALVHAGRVTVGWVGDSRAYLVAPRGAELLTRDHSWVNEVVGRGEMTEAQALLSPNAHALTRCLGPLEVGNTLAAVDPEIATRELPPGYRLVLCSDGMWNYYPHPSDIARILKSAGPRVSCIEAARRMVQRALARGGQDNVSVALHWSI